MNIGTTVTQINGVWKGVLVGIVGSEGIVKCEHGSTYTLPLAVLRESEHKTRYSKVEIQRAIAHHTTCKLGLCA